MPHVVHRDQRIHYSVAGTGPLVVFQHGLLSSAVSWRQNGFVDALADRFQVACVDSLGHGRSAKPTDPTLYGSEQRAGDLVAVIDALGAERAHVVGYSMGSWLAVAVARHQPARLASLVIGGWDCVRGTASSRPAQMQGPITFETLIAGARAAAPELVAWITADIEPGLRACWDALEDMQGSREAVLGAGVPVLLWDGQDDPYHAPMTAFAAANGLPMLSTPGDHLTAVTQHGAEAARGLRAFLESI